MRNRAKCKLCGTMIESFHSTDYVMCKCEHISIDGGPGSLRCYAKDFANFLRIDDEDKEIPVTYTDKSEEVFKETYAKPTHQEKIDMLREMVASIERLPVHAKYAPATQYDLATALMIILSIVDTNSQQ